MTPEQAADRLDRELRKHKWYQSIGVGETDDGPAIFVYVATARHSVLTKYAKGWMGYPVFVRPTGRIRAVHRSTSLDAAELR